MVSIRARLFKLYLRKKFNLNPLVTKDLVQTFRNANEKFLKDVIKEGYSIIRKETEKKVKYVIIKKDSNKPSKKIIYYLHGGAYLIRLTNMYQTFSYPLCDIRDDIEVVLLDYDPAPEQKYPSQLNQAMEIWNEITKEHKPEDIIIGGDSSGGNLGLALIHKLKNEQNVSPKACFFLSPWTDMTCSGESYYTNYQKDIQSGEANEPLTKEKENIIQHSDLFCFTGDADRKDPYISPLFGDFTTFPRSLFFVGSEEMLLDDTLKIVEKIKEKGNEVELVNKEGMFHIYPMYISYLPESREAYEKIKEFIADSFK
ncbi:alpha/beta-hydrolase [Neocallimastix lanati (nom. inval.)]|jgi:acetyl esterase/lipase|uniref:Alpha/beta-hydrolase n=1 Tax=Neocallimastix californiae TaxID=1754190 RepID=A0A1Y2ARA3_9FUNG|nr:alpha/beta-hydrolase [Neocallimastix sp. JGI-2020a]ORY25006.1 alpha/beta-hydrolase [Neocallimastix californiae]|eukprot:ORY25006.1 alpha/beta-hydrolase [Neocallimastix californiae]